MKQALVVLTLLTALVLVGCSLVSPAATSTPTAGPISHVYAFGDSYSDNGNLKQLMPGGAWGLYWEGRFSNGPVAVELLADRLNVQLTDYAVGGAKSDTGNANPLPNTGYLSQIGEFEKGLNGQSADPNALFFVLIGANDFLEKALSGAAIDNPTLTDGVVDNIAAGVTQLAQLGAKRFLVINGVEIAAMPFVVASGLSEQAAEFQTLLGSKLTGRLDELRSQLKIEITAFDQIAISDRIRESPSDYGLTNVSDACQPSLLGAVKPACDTPDQYYFWDEVHPTRRAHEIFGEAWAALFGE